jgi:hypothetical protein
MAIPAMFVIWPDSIRIWNNGIPNITEKTLEMAKQHQKAEKRALSII